MTDKLLPCPLCETRKAVLPFYSAKYPSMAMGPDNVLVLSDARDNHTSMKIQYCPMCGRPLTEEAIAAWNRRTDRWVPVGDRLPNPELSELVMVWDDVAKEWALAWYGLETEEQYDEDGDEIDAPDPPHWHGDNGEDLTMIVPTHWRELPDAPEV